MLDSHFFHQIDRDTAPIDGFMRRSPTSTHLSLMQISPSFSEFVRRTITQSAAGLRFAASETHLLRHLLLAVRRLLKLHAS